MTADFKFNPMPRMHSQTIPDHQNCLPGIRWYQVFCRLIAFGCCLFGAVAPASAAPVGDEAAARFNVRAYVIEGNLSIATNITVPVLSKYTGTNISLDGIAHAALDLQSACLRLGYPAASIVTSPQRITNGVVTFNVFQGAFSQIVISGKRYPGSVVLPAMAAQSPSSSGSAAIAALPMAPPATTAPPPPAFHYIPPSAPATPAEMAQARAALMQTMAGLAVKEQDRRVHVVATNTGPRFAVENYLIMGNSVLSPAAIARTMTNIDGDFGTNVSLDGIRTAVTELQKAYQERGYVTVVVGLPQQKLTNAVVKIQVIEGRLANIKVKDNFYYSSNNVMRALPSLHTNMILNAKIFQAELNRANASQDRQIYPVIAPGPDPGTSDLILNVKDRLPLHAKVEYNNESSPGTPALRLNSSVVYNNLWDLEHSIGVQYSFSPGFYKDGNEWNFYDRPLVANYGAFYRMPLGSPVAIADAVEAKPGTFGYDEATRKFNLPPASGQPELNFFASRSTIDTGLQTLSSSSLPNTPPDFSVDQNTVQQDLTVNNDLGVRFSTPLVASGDFHSDMAAGLDFKTFSTTSYKTNNFLFSEITDNAQGIPNPPIYSTDASPVPVTYYPVHYLPLSLNYNANWHEENSTIALGLGVTGNPWFSGSTSNYQGAVNSTKASGYWATLTPRFSWQFPTYPGWMATVRADGQWASEPLLSNEQFGAGGVNSVRGYREGDVFGDTGWHFTLQQDTPSHVVGIVYGNTPLLLRGSVYMDYARVYLLDPQGRPPGTSLWGTGVGAVFSVGTHWETRFLFSLPLLSTSDTEAYRPFFNFALTAQF
jgi:hemolysin activation/secretion protein